MKVFARQPSDPKQLTDTRSGKPNLEIKKGQCFKCGDKWALGHQCKSKTLHNIEGELLEYDDNKEEIKAETSLEEGENEREVTLNAITCYSHPRTLKLTTHIKDTEIQVLIDSGSTNNFIDPKILQNL